METTTRWTEKTIELVRIINLMYNSDMRVRARALNRLRVCV